MLRPGQNYLNKIQALFSIWTSTVQGSRLQPCHVAGIEELPLLMPEPAEKSSLHSYHVCIATLLLCWRRQYFQVIAWHCVWTNRIIIAGTFTPYSLSSQKCKNLKCIQMFTNSSLINTSWTYITGETCTVAVCCNDMYQMYRKPEPSPYIQLLHL